jgi:hypothetical protein
MSKQDVGDSSADRLLRYQRTLEGIEERCVALLLGSQGLRLKELARKAFDSETFDIRGAIKNEESAAAFVVAFGTSSADNPCIIDPIYSEHAHHNNEERRGVIRETVLRLEIRKEFKPDNGLEDKRLKQQAIQLVQYISQWEDENRADDNKQDSMAENANQVVHPTSLTGLELGNALAAVIQTNKSKPWTAEQLKPIVELNNPSRKTSVKTIEAHYVYKQLLIVQGRNRRGRSVKAKALHDVVSQQAREIDTESGKRIKGRKIRSRD